MKEVVIIKIIHNKLNNYVVIMINVMILLIVKIINVKIHYFVKIKQLLYNLIKQLKMIH